MNLSDLPTEIVIEILLFAAYKNLEFARSLTLVSSWTNRVAQQALYSTVNVVHIGDLRKLFDALGLIKGVFPKRSAVSDLFRRSFKDIPELNPTQSARDRARLIHNLWLIPLEGQDRLVNVEDHIYTRLALQLCENVMSLSLTGTAFSHFLMNKAVHFRDVRDLDTDVVTAVGWSPYPHLTHLTLLDSTPALIMEKHYERAEECVKIFNQITHFTTYGFFHSKGLPVHVHNFTSLTHVALPLILGNSIMQGNDDPTISDIFQNTGGWELLQSAPQIQMVVFLFPSDGQLCIGSHLSTVTIYRSPDDLVLTASRLHSKAYALPVQGLYGLQRHWKSAANGGSSIWDRAKDELRRHRS